MYRLCAGMLILLSGALVGCSGGGTKGPAAAPVKGTVNLDGKPMAGGEVRFSAPGFPPKVIEVKDGAFEGEAFAGSNKIEVVWDKDGPPNPTDPTTKMKVNAVADKFSGPNTPFSFEIPAGGKTDITLAVTSARR